MRFMEFVIGTFDNYQIIRDLKFQIGGHSSSVTLFTSRVFIRPIIPHVLARFPFQRNVLIFFTWNKIYHHRLGCLHLRTLYPSPLMIILMKNTALLTVPWISPGHVFSNMWRFVSIAHRLNIFRRLIPFWCERFHFQNDDHYQSMVQFCVANILRPLIFKANITRLSGWLIQVGDNFQCESTKVWRNGGNIPKARAILPPVSPHEEISKRGAGRNIIVLLFLRGILVPQSAEGAAVNMCEVKLADD